MLFPGTSRGIFFRPRLRPDRENGRTFRPDGIRQRRISRTPPSPHPSARAAMRESAMRERSKSASALRPLPLRPSAHGPPHKINRFSGIKTFSPLFAGYSEKKWNRSLTAGKNGLYYFIFTGTRYGEMAERSKAQHWKCCIGVTLSWVQIPLSPPFDMDAKLSTIVLDSPISPER